MSSQPEPWLSGTHRELPAVIRAIVHALELSRDDVEKGCAPLLPEAFNNRPSGVAPVAFHLRHIVRSLDRLLTYAEGNELSSEQLVLLKTELEPDAVSGEVLAEFRLGMENAVRRVKAFAGADLEQPRQVGRKALPTTVGGLLVHCADHTQRHTGQAVTTAKIAQSSWS
jgi:uncharacterized damage-inducible protein DinB